MKTSKCKIHALRNIRDKYQFEINSYGNDGTLILKNIYDSRLIAEKMNKHRDIHNFPEQQVKSGEIYAIGQINEVFHHIISSYVKNTNINLFSEAVDFVISNMSLPDALKIFDLYIKEFPPLSVYTGETTHNLYFKKLVKQKDFPAILEEIILLWVANQNPAFSNYMELFQDHAISENTLYPKFIKFLHGFFENKPGLNSKTLNLIDFLRAPALASPNSIQGQLDYIKNRWGSLIGDLYDQILSTIDFLKEDAKSGEFGPGPSQVINFDQQWDIDKENFSPDRDWMPSVVLIAKNIYVWLDQLSKKYQKPINKLDQIPDEELDTLQFRGFSALWLIGVWERSDASAKIKQICGNPEAIASAYSLSNYHIADQLGGEQSFQILKDRAWIRGIRLASDMVPNHMGIDSFWVNEHPDWFINLDYSPFPSYSFNGPNLSSTPDVEIKIEDHYLDRSDAAVVFKYHNHKTGITKFIYHGNDGTTMPWNDTAQLNYLIPEVREAVYQTILSVARRFSIIRFDAAMTLAKKHFQRLWFPEPGTGGAIPTRSEFGLTKAQFDQIMPEEFWREVVDRLSVESPDTLLLAEAFWLMESYFVRTLGMHRVYNSAFMNMLRDEENASYRQIIKNTLDFDPQILKRFVNFMSNPDEKTANEQFGKGDKYFGICTVMSTLPGLPMFGHGQIEGFSEKYGMEYKKAYWDETIDDHFVGLHKQIIFPILKHRWMFCEVDNFRIYDFYISENSINEDVYAYSNRVGDQHSLIIYNNKFANTHGWINHSSTQENNQTLFEALHLDSIFDFVLFKDLRKNLEYIRPVEEIRKNGFNIDLNAYESKVLIDFHMIMDDEWHSYRQLNAFLNGDGVPSIEEALKVLFLQPVLKPLKEIANKGYFDFLLSKRLNQKNKYLSLQILDDAFIKSENLIKGLYTITGNSHQKEFVLLKISESLDFVLGIPILSIKFPNPSSKKYNSSLENLSNILTENPELWLILLSYSFLSPIGYLASATSPFYQSQSWYGEYQFGKVIKELADQYEIIESDQQLFSDTLSLSIGLTGWYKEFKRSGSKEWLKKIIDQQQVQQFLNINKYKDILWFNKEKFLLFIRVIYILGYVEIGSNPKTSASSFVEESINLSQIISNLKIALEKSEFKIEKLLDNLENI